MSGDNAPRRASGQAKRGPRGRTASARADAAPRSRGEAEWWRDYFDQDFVRLYGALLPPERTRAEVAALERLLALGPGAAVLDLACGWGRHAIELARLGYRVCGLDGSQPLLEHARRGADEAGVRVGWVRGDVRRLPWSGAFDAVVNLFSSLGYFLSDAEDLRALRAARDALRPGGVFVLETMHRDSIARRFAERDWWEGPAGEHVWVEREFDAVAGVSREWLRWRLPDGSAGEKFHAIRVRSATEWNALLRRARLVPLGWYGGWALEPFTHRSARLVVRAQRAG
jgi:SAM-dependent methyltransferase